MTTPSGSLMHTTSTSDSYITSGPGVVYMTPPPPPGDSYTTSGPGVVYMTPPPPPPPPRWQLHNQWLWCGVMYGVDSGGGGHTAIKQLFGELMKLMTTTKYHDYTLSIQGKWIINLRTALFPHQLNLYSFCIMWMQQSFRIKRINQYYI